MPVPSCDVDINQELERLQQIFNSKCEVLINKHAAYLARGDFYEIVRYDKKRETFGFDN